MTNVKELKYKAEEAKILYKTKRITREEALEEVKPFIELFNIRSKEIAEKYNQKPKLISLISFLR